MQKIRDVFIFIFMIILSGISFLITIALGAAVTSGVFYLSCLANLVEYQTTGSNWRDFGNFMLFYTALFILGVIVEFLIRVVLYGLFKEKIYTNEFSFNLMKWLSYILEAIILLFLISWLFTDWFTWINFNDTFILIVVVTYLFLNSIFDEDYQTTLLKRSPQDHQ